jgi:uncharacterized membrane protein
MPVLFSLFSLLFFAWFAILLIKLFFAPRVNRGCPSARRFLRRARQALPLGIEAIND